MNDRAALCLNMIVKNEIANLDRCLTAIAPHISCWVICDTGSTDGTPEFVQSFFAKHGIPGEFYSCPFIDFAQARNEALDRARGSPMPFEFLLLADADMELLVHTPSFPRNLTSAAYAVRQRNGLTYRNVRLLRRDAQATYRGVTHEYLAVSSGETSNLNDISFLDRATGSNRGEKLKRDLRLLTEALSAERDPIMVARYVFYLANTLRDAGQPEAALRMYRRRADLGGWRQEVFMSLLNLARLMEGLCCTKEEVVAAYAKAATLCPTRAEALYGAARFCRKASLYELGYDFAVRGLSVARPEDALFAEEWVYDYGLLDELAVCAYWTGRYGVCRDACDRLIEEGIIPAEQRARVAHNRRAAVARLAEGSTRSGLKSRAVLA
ncbi:tetratricopeptide (TPR) repeat protein [Bradyrhizobium japonicum]